MASHRRNLELGFDDSCVSIPTEDISLFHSIPIQDIP